MRCAWFAYCDNDTDQTTDHPVLGPTPICQRCADHVGIKLGPARNEHGLTFDEWLVSVNEALADMTFGAVDHRDLPDWDYNDAWADGMHPSDVAEEVLAENGFEQ